MDTPSFKEDHISQIPALQMLVSDNPMIDVTARCYRTGNNHLILSTKLIHFRVLA